MYEHEHHEQHHSEDCGCGHNHHHGHHEQHHSEDCGCGHNDHHGHHEQHHGEDCSCGHEHHNHGDKPVRKQVYLVEGLDCANCAAKLEANIRALPEVEDAALTFATKQLRVSAEDPEALLPKLQALAAAFEDGVTVTPLKRNRTTEGVYRIEGLDCANCAAKIEAKICAMDGVDNCTITFATKQLRLAAANPDRLIPEIQKLINTMEDGVTVVPLEKRPGKEQENGEDEAKKNRRIIAIGFVLFLTWLLLEWMKKPAALQICVLGVAYLLLGGEVLLTAGRNILRGQVFDENFLMSVATLGAFAIGDFPEAVGVMLFYRIGEYFEDRAVYQSRKQIMEAVDLRPEVVNLVDGDEVHVMDAAAVEVGDVLLVRPGDRIPLDGVILEGETRIDTSPVTGESVPVKAGAGDSVISGCVNTSGLLKLRVEKPLEESMVTRILDTVENAAASKPAIDRFITRFARVYTPAVVLAALAVAVLLPFLLPGWHFFVKPDYTGEVGVMFGTTGSASVLTALTFLVISCPCALVLSVPLAFFAGIGAASRKGILFKGGNVIEVLAGVRAVIMDKTGTVTKGNFTVQACVPADYTVSADELLRLTAGVELSSSHPIAVSIVTAAEEKGLTPERPLLVQEIAGLGIWAQTEQGTLLSGSRRLLEEHGVDLRGYQKSAFGAEVLTARNGKYIGHIIIADTLKEDAQASVAKMKRQGLVTAMLTGDAEDSARYIAGETDIDEVHARLLPENKLTELQKIRRACGAVMFVGDGINDAPVLAGADVGAAMGSGADAAIEAADVVFMTSKMSAIPDSIEIARAARRISWQNVWFALGIKLGVMVLSLLGHPNMWIAVFADTGVAMLCLLNSVRILRMK